MFAGARVCAHHAGRKCGTRSARAGVSPSPSSCRASSRGARAPNAVGADTGPSGWWTIFEVDVMCISTPRKHENKTRRTAQSHDLGWAKGFGPAEGGFRGSTSGSLSHSVRGVWERVRVRALLGYFRSNMTGPAMIWQAGPGARLVPQLPASFAGTRLMCSLRPQTQLSPKRAIPLRPAERDRSII